MARTQLALGVALFGLIILGAYYLARWVEMQASANVRDVITGLMALLLVVGVSLVIRNRALSLAVSGLLLLFCGADIASRRKILFTNSKREEEPTDAEPEK